MSELTSENYVQNLVMNDQNIKSQILEKLNISDQQAKFHEKIKHANNLYPDVIIESQNKIFALIECKGANIGANDFVRGTGQLLQYEHYFETKSSPLGKEYSRNFNDFLMRQQDLSYLQSRFQLLMA